METRRIVKKQPKTKAFTTEKSVEEVTAIETHDFGNVVSEKDEILDAFRFFDGIDRGHLSCREYFNILLQSGEFKESEIALIIKESGLEMNDNLNYNNFYDFWKYQ